MTKKTRTKTRTKTERELRVANSLLGRLAAAILPRRELARFYLIDALGCRPVTL